MNPRRDGFTLIELLMVMVILGLLAAISIPYLWQAKDRGLESTMQADLRKLSTFQELYYESHFAYTADVDELPGFIPSPGVEIEIGYAESDGWAGIARHGSLATRECGMIVGDAPPEYGTPATSPGMVTCDEAESG
jgi:prepilin-type N-terminal cleavage/methylation domain-containing protein